MTIDQLKLPKQVIQNLLDLGFTEPTEVQEACFSRINGGQELLIVGPDGIGKTTLMVLSTIAKLKYAVELAPRAVIVTPTKEKGEELTENFRKFAWDLDLRVLELYHNVDEEEQRELLREGCDIVIGTPDRILKHYIRSGINFTQLKLFIVEDAQDIIKEKKQVIIKNIAENLKKVQYIITATEFSQKLDMLGGYVFTNHLEADFTE